MDRPLRWKFRAAAFLGLLVSTPGAAEVVYTGSVVVSGDPARPGGVVAVSAFVLCSMYLAWSVLVSRFEESRPVR